ncbi:MAG: pseudouridine synthase [Brevundimonas sp.]|uniref:pseudouridine synthase n=1 Tax=Brevundimonas sp. TaxID=1871086 RepID=UPI0022CA259E|nr:pseudouridine synthase [Brevundimonas sp.]MCZ8193039.1 pseudouridine synthase [Brevundimonas sp.]
MIFRRTYGGTEPQRINKWLAQSGVCSRREAEALIADGLVRIDGERVTDAGRKILQGQTLELAEHARAALAAVTIILNKPAGYVSGQPEPGKTPAARLLTAANAVGDLHPPGRDALPPLGRLDEDSRGLLLLSSDGVLAKAVIGPESRLDKAYRVRVAGRISPSKIARLRFGLALDGRPLKRAEVEQVGDQDLTFVLTEGRNRQIRRMAEMVDLRVVDLQRKRIGPLNLGDLPEGRWRVLDAAEREAIIAAS